MQNTVILNYIKSFYPEVDEEKLSAFISNHYKREEFKRKSLLFSSGQANTRHYFVEKGLLRLYLLDPNGREFNLLFAKEGQVLGDLSTPQPTAYYLETVEPSIVYSIDEKHLQELGRLMSAGANSSTDLMRRSYLFLQKRLVAILSKTAEENYLDLRDNYPDLIRRLPQYHIASYLGVSAEFLSKIIARTAKA